MNEEAQLRIQLLIENLNLKLQKLSLEVQEMRNILCGQVRAETKSTESFTRHVNQYAADRMENTAQKMALLIAVRSLMISRPRPEECRKFMEIIATMMQANNAMPGEDGDAMFIESKNWLDWLSAEIDDVSWQCHFSMPGKFH